MDLSINILSNVSLLKNDIYETVAVRGIVFWFVLTLDIALVGVNIFGDLNERR